MCSELKYAGWIGQWAGVSGCGARGWEFDFTLSFVEEKPVCVTLGAQSQGVPPEKGAGKPLLSTPYLGNSGKNHHVGIS